ncbi:MAG: hypothetical protein ABIF85_07345 [Nanoarchaeota archaeon]|nr:hypothetical protein [Nanoarchaeota archaeon]MBU4299696.1 hypothetical protein [Nanoarchaeota archaeon]MBU4451204.1 hypothetical protein [Nanoarchaeota archaeon]MCG2723302.1 hypothetical protein [archaeon]
MSSETLFKNPLILIFVGILLMIVDGAHYGIDVANFGFLLTLVGVVLYFIGVKA